jgi:hypothetical protein
MRRIDVLMLKLRACSNLPLKLPMMGYQLHSKYSRVSQCYFDTHWYKRMLGPTDLSALPVENPNQRKLYYLATQHPWDCINLDPRCRKSSRMNYIRTRNRKPNVDPDWNHQSLVHCQQPRVPREQLVLSQYK